VTGQPSAILTARGIGRRFGERVVLDGLDLEVRKGEFIAIVGRSGVGKSTLLSIIGLHDPAYGGEVVIDGNRVGDLQRPELAELRRTVIGFVFQDFHLLPNLTALENVILPAVFSGADLEAAEEQAREVLTHLSLRLDDTPTSLLSRGERQRAAVARGLVNRPRILMADEPSASLDEESENRLFDLLDQIREEQGFAMLAVVHSGSILRRADRVLRLEDGRLHED
jgi:ABC-type lipoprotein export system ATPase subunit